MYLVKYLACKMVWDFCRYNGTTKLAPLYATKGKVIEQANAKLYNIRKSEFEDSQTLAVKHVTPFRRSTQELSGRL